MGVLNGVKTFGRFIVGRTSNKSIFIYTMTTYLIFILLWALAIILYPYKYSDFSLLHITISELGRSRKHATTRVFVLFNTAMMCFVIFFLPFVFAQFFRYREGLKGIRWAVIANGLGLAGSLIALIGCMLLGIFHLDGVYGNKVHDGCAYVAFIGIILWMITASLIQLYRGVRGMGYPNIITTSFGLVSILIVLATFLGIGVSPWYRESVWEDERVERALFIIFEWCGFFCFVSWLLFNVISLMAPPRIPCCARSRVIASANSANNGTVSTVSEKPVEIHLDTQTGEIETINGTGDIGYVPTISSYSYPTYQGTTTDVTARTHTGSVIHAYTDSYPTSGVSVGVVSNSQGAPREGIVAHPSIQLSPYNPYLQNVDGVNIATAVDSPSV